MICRNCGCELIIVGENKYLHAYNINIGTKTKPYLVKGAALMSRTTTCYNPEPESVIELIDNKTKEFKEKILK